MRQVVSALGFRPSFGFRTSNFGLARQIPLGALRTYPFLPSNGTVQMTLVPRVPAPFISSDAPMRLAR